MGAGRTGGNPRQPPWPRTRPHPAPPVAYRTGQVHPVSPIYEEKSGTQFVAAPRKPLFTPKPPKNRTLTSPASPGIVPSGGKNLDESSYALRGAFDDTPTGKCITDAITAAKFPMFRNLSLTFSYKYDLK